MKTSRILIFEERASPGRELRLNLLDHAVEFDFRDSWRHEVAAYELDKLLGLGLVPPTVERRIARQAGSLQMWVEGATTEDDRKQEGRAAPDAEAWNARIDRMMGKALDSRPAQSYAEGLLTYRTSALRFSRKDREDLHAYLVANFGPGAKPRMVRVEQEMPFDEAALGKAIIHHPHPRIHHRPHLGRCMSVHPLHHRLHSLRIDIAAWPPAAEWSATAGALMLHRLHGVDLAINLSQLFVLRQGEEVIQPPLHDRRKRLLHT